jgi:hypothetical protein
MNNLVKFCENHFHEQRMRSLSDHIANADTYTILRKRLQELELSLINFSDQLTIITQKCHETVVTKDRLYKEYQLARSRLTRDHILTELASTLYRYDTTSLNLKTEKNRLFHECENVKEEISEVSFCLNRLRSKMIRMKNPCYKKSV